LTPEPVIRDGALYKVITHDKREFETRDLHLTDEAVNFTSGQVRYSFPRAEVDQVVLVEVDGSRTFVAVLAIGAVVLTGLYFFLREFVGGVGSASGAN
jgi:hypothetical protein